MILWIRHIPGPKRIVRHEKPARLELREANFKGLGILMLVDIAEDQIKRPLVTAETLQGISDFIDDFVKKARTIQKLHSQLGVLKSVLRANDFGIVRSRQGEPEGAVAKTT